MKKVIVALSIIFAAVSMQASSWMHDYDVALAKAQKVHKPILMMFESKD